MNRLLKWTILLALATLLTAAPICFASVDQEMTQKSQEAETQLKRMVDEVLVLIRDKDLAATPKDHEQALYNKAFDIFDFNTFAMLALGAKYRDFSSQQREEFILYFSKLISQTYFPKLAGQDVDNLTILYLDNQALKPKREIYRTDISTELVQGDLHIPIIYRMIQKNDAPWKIYDVKIEGVSMAANYREQYRQQISATPEEIIAELKEKVAP